MVKDVKTNSALPIPAVPRLIRGREEYVLGVLLLVVVCITAVILHGTDKYAFLYYGDAASHIVKARQFVDSQEPWLDIIGTVWLPLPHLLLLPFTAIDSLFFSGIAGPALGIPCLVGTGILLFLIVRRLTGSQPVAFISACLFCLNPNVVYISLTPMNEACLFFFVALGGYGLLRWVYEGSERWLLVCAAAVMMATLCRYEAWLLAPFVSLVAATKGLSAWTQSDRTRAIRLFWIALLSLAGIIFWFCWNKYEFGDALRFAPWNFRPAPSDLNNPMRYRQEAVSLTLLRAVLNIFGPVTLLACATGIVRLRRVALERRHLLLFVFLGLPAFFVFTGTLFDYVLIDQWWWNWRFVLTFGLFLSVVGGIGLSEFFKKVRSRAVRGVVVASLLAMPIVQLTVPSVSVATYEDASKIFGGLSKYAAGFGEQLRSIHKGGSVVLFTGSGLGERIMVSSWLPLRNFHLIQVPGGLDIQGPIRSGDRYVAIGKVRLPDSREVVDYWLSRRELFMQYYDIRFEDENYLLLERKEKSP
jgi:hypothetical protein